MRNLKRMLAVIVAICVLATFAVPAFADTTFAYGDQATKLYNLGLYKGTGNPGGEFVPALDKEVDRQTAFVLLLRLLGLEDEALKLTDAEATAALKDKTDAADVPAMFKKQIAYAVSKGIYLGKTTTTLNAKEACTGDMFAAWLLRNLGYSQPDATGAAAVLVSKGGLTADQATAFAAKNLIRDDMVGMMFGSLQAADSTGKKVIDNLVASGDVTAAAAEAAGVYTAYKPVALDVSSAVAINSKVVEVTLATAAVAADLVGVTVKDSAGTAVAVSKIEFAPWATDGKTVLVTLGADTAVGTYYTLTSGAKSANFGGKAADADKPTVTVTSNDYNELILTFSEPILLGGTVEIAKKYGDKAALATSGIVYNGKDSIKITTAEQAASTLYGVTVKSFTDLAGNKMDDNAALTFVGVAKDTTAFAGIAVTPVDSTTVEVDYNKKIDSTTTLDASKYTVKLKYSPYTAIAVTSVAAKAGVVDTVVLTLASDTAVSLYEVTAAAGVTTAYGTATTAALTGTFVGIAKDEAALASPVAAPVSNTKITVTFGSDAIKDAVDTATTKDAFSIKMKYSPYTELAISGISITDNVVTLTTAAQSTVLYEVTVKTGIKDKKGNATTADLKTTFVGKAVAAKITGITSITRNDATHITVKFNQNVGTSVTDVAHYSIDGGVGYPEKAETTSNADEVKLTIPKTTVSKLYTLTVKGLENADGVAMDAAGVTAKFAGLGISATEPTVEAVMAVDAQTIKVYFDRAVSDSSITGATKLVNGTSLVAGAFLYNDLGSATQDIAANTEYAYTDPSNANVLVIRVDDTSAFKVANLRAGTTMFTLTADAAKVANDTGLPFAPVDTAPSSPEVVGVVANDAKTLTVYFSEDVDDVDAADFAIDALADGSGANGPVVNSVFQVDAKTYKLGLATAMAAQSYYLRVVEISGNDADETIDLITDKTGLVELKATVPATGAGDYTAAQFAGSAAAVSNITDVQVVMTDARTIVIYYPEAMEVVANDGTDVMVATNYEIENFAGGNLINTGANVTMTTWSGTNNTLTLTLDTDLSASVTGYYVKFAQTLANALGTKIVDNAGAAVRAQFAVSTVEAAKVAIESVEFANAGSETMTITFNMDFTTNADIDADAGGVALQATAETNLLAILDATIPGITFDAAAITDIDAFDADGVDVADTTAGYVKTIVITLGDGATAGEVGSASVKLEAGFVGINGMGGNTSSVGTFIQ